MRAGASRTAPEANAYDAKAGRRISSAAPYLACEGVPIARRSGVPFQRFLTAVNGERFRTYAAPSLIPGDTVLMDNLGTHKVAGAREAPEAAGAQLLSLPPYSPSPSSKR